MERERGFGISRSLEPWCCRLSKYYFITSTLILHQADGWQMLCILLTSEPFKFDLLCHHHQSRIENKPFTRSLRVRMAGAWKFINEIHIEGNKEVCPGAHSQISDSYSMYVWWVQTIAGIFMTGPQISGAVTREWDLHGTEGIEFHGSCFFFFYAASAPRLAGIWIISRDKLWMEPVCAAGEWLLPRWMCDGSNIRRQEKEKEKRTTEEE